MWLRVLLTAAIALPASALLIPSPHHVSTPVAAAAARVHSLRSAAHSLRMQNFRRPDNGGDTDKESEEEDSLYNSAGFELDVRETEPD